MFDDTIHVFLFIYLFINVFYNFKFHIIPKGNDS